MRFLLAAWLLLAAAVAQAQPAPGYSGLGATSVTPEVLARFRPPPLPPALSRRIQALLDLRAPGLGMPSPDGKRLYFGWRVTGVDQVWRLDGPNQFPQQLTGGEDRTTLAGVSPDGRWLALQRDRQGEENPGLYLQGSDGGPLIEIQHKAGVQTQFQGFSPDGRWLYHVANDVRPDSYAVYRVELATRRSERLYDGQGYWRIGDIAPGRLLLVKATGSVTSEWSLFDEATRTLTPLLGQGERLNADMAFAAAAGEYIVNTPKPTGFRRLYRWRAGGVFTPVPLPGGAPWEVERFSLDTPRTHLYAAVNEGGYTRSVALDARNFQPLALPWPAGADHQLIGASSPDGRRVVLGVARPDGPRRAYVWDWQTRRLTPWTIPSTPEIDATRFVPAVLESYPARDGTAIPMFVRRSKACAEASQAAAEPPQGGLSPLGGQRSGAAASVGVPSLPCPVIVNFHGGPEGQSQPGFSPIWQFFVDAGFVIAEPNVRGSSGYGQAWLDADNGPKRLDVITDIEDAAIHIRKQWARNGVAPKVGVFGGSYGGYAALMAMTRFAGAYDAGVSSVGIANLLTFLQNTAPYRRALRISEYGDPVADHDALVQLSPTTWVDQLQAPLMIIQGANDPRVPVGESLLMFEAAQRRGVPVELLIFADEGHGASTRANQALEFGHLLRFFQQHLMSTEATR